MSKSFYKKAISYFLAVSMVITGLTITGPTKSHAENTGNQLTKQFINAETNFNGTTETRKKYTDEETLALFQTSEVTSWTTDFKTTSTAIGSLMTIGDASKSNHYVTVYTKGTVLGIEAKDIGLVSSTTYASLNSGNWYRLVFTLTSQSDGALNLYTLDESGVPSTTPVATQTFTLTSWPTFNPTYFSIGGMDRYTDNQNWYFNGAMKNVTLTTTPTNLTLIKNTNGSAESIEVREGSVASALDGDSCTYWHSSWSNTAIAPIFATNTRNTFTINFDKLYTIQKFVYVPRQDMINGVITKYKLYYSKTADGTDFEAIPEGEGTWAENKNTKSISFHPLQARRVKIQVLGAKGDNSGLNLISAADFKVYAVTNVPVTGVTVSPETATIKAVETVSLSAIVMPTNATKKDITWSTSDANIATVSTDGVVTGVSEGTATITAASVTGTASGSSIIMVEPQAGTYQSFLEGEKTFSRTSGDSRLKFNDAKTTDFFANNSTMAFSADIKTTNANIGGIMTIGGPGADNYATLYTMGTKIGLEARDSSLNMSATVTGLNDGNWHIVKLIITDGKKFDLSVDGTIVTSVAKDYPTWISTYSYDPTYFSLGGMYRVGKEDTTTNNWYFDGSMRNVSVKRVIPTPPPTLNPTIGSTYKIFSYGYEGSNAYRIPSLLTTAKGTVLAAIDKRWQDASDWNNIDTVVRRSTDNGATWSDSITVADTISQPGSHTASSFLIDASMVQDTKTSDQEGRVFLLVDFFSQGGGFGAANNNASGTGYLTIDGKSYLKLTDASNNVYTVRENGIVYNSNNEATTYTVATKVAAPYKTLGDLYQAGTRVGNIYLRGGSDGAPLTVQQTAYLWLSYSDDEGQTWSQPVDLTPQVKADWMKFIGTGPGVGIQLKHGEHTGRLLFPIYYTNTNGKQSSSTIYSDDGGKTWTRSESPNDGRDVNGTILNSQTITGNEITESQIVELNNGHIIQFMRNGSGKVLSAISQDAGVTWSNVLRSEPVTDVYCQLSAIHYSSDIDVNNDGTADEIIVFSNPAGSGRSNGTVRIGIVNPDDTINWAYSKLIHPGSYSYSCLTELANGNLGLLYEDGGILYTSFNLDFIRSKNSLPQEPKYSSMVCTMKRADGTAAVNLSAGKVIEIKVTTDQEVIPSSDCTLKIAVGNTTYDAILTSGTNASTAHTFAYIIKKEDIGNVYALPVFGGNLKNADGYQIIDGNVNQKVFIGTISTVDITGDLTLIPNTTGSAESVETTEGSVAAALDGNTTTFWHSSWSNKATAPVFATHTRNTFTIAFDKLYNIQKFEYVPRQSSPNGAIKEFVLSYSKTVADDDFVPIPNGAGTWEANYATKNIIFEAVGARRVKIEVLAAAGDNSDLNLITAAEFKVYSTTVNPTSLNLDPKPTELAVGETSEITASMAPENTDIADFEWTSSDPNIVAITGTGNKATITALTHGTATITAKETSSLLTASFTVAVKETTIPVISVTVSPDTQSVKVGAFATLTAEVAPSNATESTVVWTTSDDKVATVANGVVTGVAAGTATITATCGAQSDTCLVTVTTNDVPPIEVLTLINNMTGAADSEETTGETAPASQALDNDTNTFWHSAWDNTENAPVFAESLRNTYTITFDKLYNIRKFEYVPRQDQPRVNGAIKQFKLYYSKEDTGTNFTELTEGTWEVNPDTKNIEFGIVEARRLKIEVSDAQGDDTGLDLICAAEFRVYSSHFETPTPDPDTAVTTVTVTPETQSIEAGKTAALTAVVEPSNATNKNITWTSSDTNVATVTNGVVTGVTAGTATITAISADGKQSDTCVVTVTAAPIVVTKVTISSKTQNIKVGATATLTATVEPADAANKTVTWSSSNNNVVTVTNGVVTGVAAGTATITVSSVNGIKDTCVVTVTANPVAVSTVTVSPMTQSIKVGTTATLVVEVTPANAADKTITWSSSNTNVATVNNGVVTGVAIGTVTITARTNNGISDTCVVTVTTASVAVTKVTVSLTTKSMKTDETTTLTAVVSPTNATNKAVTWTSSNTNVATVNNGVVTGIAAGTATITATTVDGKFTATCVVTVTKKDVPTTPSTSTGSSVSTIYKVSFDADGGSVATTSKTVTKNQNYGTLPVPTRNDYTFMGWYTAKTDGTKVTDSTSFTSSSDVILYARWMKNPTAVADIKISKPSKPILTVKAVGKMKKAVKLTWSKTTKADYFVIQMKTGKGAYKTIKVNSSKSCYYTVSKVKSGSTYSFRIKGYKVLANDKNVYGNYSNVVKVTVK